MTKSLFGFILKHSLRQQIWLVILTSAAFPFIYLQAELPKRIVNDAISAEASTFPKEIWGFSFNQLGYLAALCCAFLVLVLINGAFKYVLNVSRGRLGERMLRRLRYDLYSRVLRFPMPHFRRVSQGELIPMLTQEVETLGGFIGDAIAQPLYQAGILVTLFAFILVQDPLLGIAAVALFPVQAAFIPVLQRKVNNLAKERVRTVRRLSDHLGESIAGIGEIRANDGTTYQRARFSQRLGVIYHIRYKIFLWKFMIKFINNFLAQFTPFMFYSVGGYLAIKGELSVGALVAVVSAHKDMSAPWKELLTYYQQREDARIKYEQVMEQFDPPGLVDPKLQESTDVTPFGQEANVALRGVVVSDEDGTVYLQQTNLEFALSEKIAITGPSGGGKEELAPLLARLDLPTSGRIIIGDEDLATLPEGKIGRHLGYVSGQPYLFAGSVRENLLLALRFSPPTTPDDSPRAWVLEAKLTGNALHDPEGDWIDYAGLGVNDGDGLGEHIRQSLRGVMLAEDIYELGLRGRPDLSVDGSQTARFLDARRALRERLEQDDLAGLVEQFDRSRFNGNATVGENLLFGTPIGGEFDMDHLGQHPFVRKVLDKTRLTDDFVNIGLQVATTMVDLFADFESSHELMEQYSFISGEDLPVFQSILSRANRSSGPGVTVEDRAKLISLPFRLAPDRHRLGLIDEKIQERVLEARKVFMETLPEELNGAVAFFDPEKFNPASSIQDNLLFGKIVHGRPKAEAQVRAALSQILHDLELIDDVVDVGLGFEVGVGGSRLSSVQRQKLAIARALIKNPATLILNNPFGPFDELLRESLLDRIIDAQGDRGVIAVMDHVLLPDRFDRILTAEGGYVMDMEEARTESPKAAE